MRRLISILFLSASLNMFAQDMNINDITFTGVSVKPYVEDFNLKESANFNITYSSILPYNGIYKVVDVATKKEAIIQVGYVMKKLPPSTLYLSETMYDFFAESEEVKELELQVKFLGWSTKDGEETDFLDIKSLVVKPSNSENAIIANGTDKYYLQLGSYSYYQNSYPKITEMLPYLEIRPNFFMIKKKVMINDEEKTVFRVLAGPYTKENAAAIAVNINKSKDPEEKDRVFLKAGETVNHAESE